MTRSSSYLAFNVHHQRRLASTSAAAHSIESKHAGRLRFAEAMFTCPLGCSLADPSLAHTARQLHRITNGVERQSRFRWRKLSKHGVLSLSLQYRRRLRRRMQEGSVRPTSMMTSLSRGTPMAAKQEGSRGTLLKNMALFLLALTSVRTTVIEHREEIEEAFKASR